MKKESRIKASIILYEKGLTITAIAQAFGCSMATISSNLPEHMKDPKRKPLQSWEIFQVMLKLLISLYHWKNMHDRNMRRGSTTTIEDETNEWLWKAATAAIPFSSIISMLQGSYRTLCIQSAGMFPNDIGTKLMGQIWQKPGSAVNSIQEKAIPDSIGFGQLEAAFDTFSKYESDACNEFLEDLFEEHSSKIADCISYADLTTRIIRLFTQSILSPDFQHAFSKVWNGQEVVKELILDLTEREREIVILFYGLACKSLSLEAIGEKFNLTRERVRQIKEKAIQRLQRKFKEKELQFPLVEL